MGRSSFEWHCVVALALAVAFCAVPHAASASEIFPPRLKKIWTVKAKLPGKGSDGCPLCHTSDPGRSGTATSKFALGLRSYGLSAGDVNSLETALDKNRSAKRDSDGDGFTDFEEVATDGTNPWDPKSHVTVVEQPPAGGGGEGGGPSQAPASGGTEGEEPEGDAGAATAPVPECITETIYPHLRYGCDVTRGETQGGLAFLLVPLGLLALVRKRKRPVARPRR